MRKFLLLITLPFVVAQITAQDTSRAHKPDSLTAKMLEEVTIYASRIPESISLSPVSVEKVTSSFFKNAAAPSFFDALEHIKGVQMITPSLGFRILNTRGFANTTNVRFAQLTDGMDVQSPQIGGPIGSALGPGDLDIDNVEILPGAAAALYGMNSINGLANFSTKNPFISPGFSFLQKTAVTHLGDPGAGAKVFSETSFRYAHVLSEKFAFKLNVSFVKGYDWEANNYSDQNPDANKSTGLIGNNNPGADAINSYGNESSDRRTIALGGKNFVVARTGYTEKQLVDYGLQNIKGDAGLYYRIRPGVTISYLYHFAVLNNVYQRANRFRLQDYFIQQHGLQLQSPSVTARIYYNGETTGKSYNLRSMGENIDRNYKPDTKWYQDYASGYNSAVMGGSSVADAHRQARTVADAGRYQPGTMAFDNVLSKLQNINNWDSGAALRVKDGFVQAEAQWNLTAKTLAAFKKATAVELLAGLDHRTYIIQPDGNYFINPNAGKSYDNIYYGKTGVFVSATKNLMHNKLKLGAALRADKNDYFPVLFNPRFTAVYSPLSNHHFRASFQAGYRYPIIFEAYSNVNSGGTKRVGGLPVMSNGIFENAWLLTSISSFQSAVLTDVNQNGFSKNAAIEKNKGLLKKNPYTYIQPEHVNAIEFGYKAALFDNRLQVDADIYFNNYRSFIAQANMNVPLTSNADSIPYYLNDKTKQSPYRMWTNSQSVVHNYGFSMGLQYLFIKNYLISGNASFSKLKKAVNEDGLEDGFNTPAWMVNAAIGNDNLFRNFGAGISWKWQTGYLWQSFLVNANVAAYWTADAQLSYQFTKTNIQLKLGASNIFNRYYYSIAGGPQIGGMYYLSFRFGAQ